MTDQTIITLVAAIPTTIAAVGALLVSLRTAKNASESAKKADTKADTIIEKAAEIHTLTNSAMAKVQAALAIATEKIAGLETLIANMKAAALEASTERRTNLLVAAVSKPSSPKP